MAATIQEEILLKSEAEAKVLGAPVVSTSSLDDAVKLNAAPAPGYSGVHEQSTPFHSFLEHSTLILFPFLFAPTLYFGLARLYHLDYIWWVLLAVPIGVIAGDFVSGMVHWFADTYFTEETPIIGKSLVKPFRLHHVYPRDICTHSVVEIAGNVCILAVPVLSVCLYLLWLLPQSGLLAFTVVCVAVLSITTVATNQFHKWAHQEEPSVLACRLQRTHLVLTPTHHQLHHTAPYNLHYCITNGWLNPILNKIKFFRRLEAVLGWFGIKPTNVEDYQHN